MLPWSVTRCGQATSILQISVSMSIKENHSTDLIGLLLFFKWVVFFCLFLFLGTNEMTYKQHLAKAGYLGRLDSKIASYCEEIPIN